MTKVALLTVHGIGKTAANYADPLIATLRSRLGAEASQVAFLPVYYQNILQANEDRVWQETQARNTVHYATLREWLLFGFGDAAGIDGDRLSTGAVYLEVQWRIARALLAAHDALGGVGPVVALTQSLGGHVLSNYLWDAQAATNGRDANTIWQNMAAQAPARLGRAPSQAERATLRGGGLCRWVSTGCNIPLFVASHPIIQAIAKPCDDFEWLNLYDPDDVLGWPLRPLSPSYDNLVVDREINAGQGLADLLFKSWNPLSHTAYWTDDDVLEPLLDRLRLYLN